MARFEEDVEIIDRSLILKQSTGLVDVSGLGPLGESPTPIGEKDRIRIQSRDDDSIEIFDRDGMQAFRMDFQICPPRSRWES